MMYIVDTIVLQLPRYRIGLYKYKHAKISNLKKVE